MKLLPCPFCHHAPSIIEAPGPLNLKISRIKCFNCGLHTGRAMVQEVVILRWNVMSNNHGIETEQLSDKPKSRSKLINILRQGVEIIKSNLDNFSYTTEEHQKITHLMMELLGCKKDPGTNFDWQHPFFSDIISITTNAKDNILIEIANNAKSEGYKACQKNIQKELGII